MDFTKICRFCLNTHNLSPIFYDGTKHNRISTAIFIITGVKVDQNDGSPQQLCKNCINELNNYLEFRKKCQMTESKINEFKGICNYENTSIGFHLEFISVKKEESYLIEIKKESNSDAEDNVPLSSFATNVSDDEISSEFSKTETIKKLRKIDPKSKILTRCPECSKTLCHRSLMSHMDLFHPGSNGRVKCELCDKYLMQYKMKRHLKLKHGVYNEQNGNNILKCGYCKEDFENKQFLLDHVSTCDRKKKKRRVYDKEKAITTCDICNKRMQQASLRMHKAIKHSGLGPVCQHCGKVFGNKLRLQEHCRAKHGYEKFKCSVCDFQTASTLSLKNHERRHNGEKPFQCETCGAKFHAAYLLAQHKQSHRPEKIMKCDECSATFKANNALHMHKSACHSKCSYRCFLCDRTYNCRHYVVKHLRHFHDFKEKVGSLEKVFEKKNSDGTKILEEL